MARVTIEDCLEHAPNRFALAVIAARRSFDLLHGARPLVSSDNKHVVVALREVAAQKIDFDQEIPLKPKELAAPQGA